MEKLREFKNYMGLQMYYFKNAVSETKQDAVTEAKNKNIYFFLLLIFQIYILF